MSDLDETLNQQLANYSATGVVGVGLDYGNDKNRAGILLEMGGTNTSQIVIAESFSNSGALSDLREDVNDWLAEQNGKITILGLALKKSNEKWKALILYGSMEDDAQYQAESAENTKFSDEQAAVEEDLNSAKDVVAFAFAYGNTNYGSLWINKT